MNAVARILLFAVTALASDSSWATCATPSTQSLLGRDIPGCCKVISQPLIGTGHGLAWAAVSWNGPVGGKLYVLDCNGSKVATADSLGYIERLEEARSIGGMPTIKVTYIPAAGTGIKLRSIALVQFRARQLTVLWKHAVLDAAYMPGMGANYEEHTSWRFRDGRRRIEATTLRVSPPHSSHKVTLPAERFCLRTSVWRYVPCE